MLTPLAGPRDEKMSPAQETKLIELQESYVELIHFSRKRRRFDRMIRDVAARANVINRKDRLTGNSLTLITEMLMKAKEKNLKTHEFQKVIETMIDSQVLVPEKGFEVPEKALKHHKSSTRKILKNLFQVLEDYSDDI